MSRPRPARPSGRSGWCVALCFALSLPACEVELSEGPGLCFGSCTLPNAKSACIDQTCRVLDCAAGFGACNGRDDDGCEADLRSDELNCAVCGYGCAGNCVNGSCRALEVVASSPQSSFVPIAVDTAHVYWATNAGVRTGQVARAPKLGGAPELLWPSRDWVIAVATDRDRVYWLEEGEDSQARAHFRLKAGAKAGGAVVELGASLGSPENELVLHDGFAYVVINGSRTGSVQRIPLAGGRFAPLPGFPRDGWPYQLQRDGDRLIFGFVGGEPTPSAPRQALVEYDTRTHTFRYLHEDFYAPSFAVQGTDVFVVTRASRFRDDARLWRISLSSGKETNLGVSPLRAASLISDDGSLFLVDFFRRSVARYSPAGARFDVLAGEQTGLAQIALDRGHVYFANSEGIVRVAR